LRKLIRKIYHFVSDIKNSSLLHKNKILNKQYSGICHIIATGVSINDYDVNEISAGFKVGIGFIQFNNSISSEFFDAYVDVEPITTYKRAYGNRGEIFYTSLDKKISKEGALVFLRTDAKKIVDKYRLFSEQNVYYLDTEIYDSNKNNHICCDITKRIPLVQGGISAAMLTSIYMGFNKIYLHGAGYTYNPMQIFHYYNEDFSMQNTFHHAGVAPIEIINDVIMIAQCDSDSTRIKLIEEVENRRSISFYDFKEINNFLLPRFVSYKGNYDRHELLNQYANSMNVHIITVMIEGFTSEVYDSVTPDDTMRH